MDNPSIKLFKMIGTIKISCLIANVLFMEFMMSDKSLVVN